MLICQCVNNVHAALALANQHIGKLAHYNMLKRIVKMTFQEDKIEDFLQVFNESKQRIRHFPGCRHLELWRTGTIFFTYSMWEDEAALNHYRYSELFKTTWAKTKVLFADKPEAWSLELVDAVAENE